MIFTGGMLLLALLQGCEKEIKVTPLAYTEKLSIQSLITPGRLPKVSLYRTVAYFDAKQLSSQLFIRRAGVRMSSLAGDITFAPDSDFNSFTCEYDYFYRGNQVIAPNRTYQLEIAYNQQVYTATATTDQVAIKPDSISYVKAFKDVYGEHEGIVVHFRDVPGRGNYYRYEMTRFLPGKIVNAAGVGSACSSGNDVHYVKELGRTIYSDEFTDGGMMTFVFEPTYQHKAGQQAYVRLQTVDRAIYEFYNQLDQQKLAQYNPFVEPVFIRPGQFGQHAIGVFGAFALSDSLKFVYPE
jgi:hypothetical protein